MHGFFVSLERARLREALMADIAFICLNTIVLAHVYDHGSALLRLVVTSID